MGLKIEDVPETVNRYCASENNRNGYSQTNQEWHIVLLQVVLKA
jgi:hypothetical protein